MQQYKDGINDSRNRRKDGVYKNEVDPSKSRSVPTRQKRASNQNWTNLDKPVLESRIARNVCNTGLSHESQGEEAKKKEGELSVLTT